MKTRVLLLLAAFALPALASADPLTGSIYNDSGLEWWLVITAVITLIEWPIFALMAKYSWGLSLPIIALANVASGVLGILLPSLMFLVVVPGFVLELLVVYAAVQAFQRARVRAPAQLFIPVLLMNLATFWIAPAVQMRLPIPSGDTSRCMGCIHALGDDIKQYAERHNGDMPRVTTMRQLRAALGATADDERKYHCAGREGLQLVAPLTEKTEFILLLPWPTRWAEGDSSSRVILADPRPIHHDGRMCLYADDHAKWLSETTFQLILNSKGHTDRR